jgi:mRNA-degrading endonuclease toxin of MazEF toxin-antitoxin module
MTQRGDIVIVAFPFVSGGSGKNRPALVIQCDRNNHRLTNTIVAMITGNTRLATTEPTQLLIDPGTPDGNASGLAFPSAVKCENLFTVSQQDIIRTVGTLPAMVMAQIDDCLKAALGMP